MDYIINLYKGRIGRRHLILGLLFAATTVGALGLIIFSLFGLFGLSEETLLLVFSLIIGLPWFLFVFSLYVRRLHDINISGWYIIGLLLPVVGLIEFLYLLLIGGNEKLNRYGEPPSDEIKFFNAIFNVDGKN